MISCFCCSGAAGNSNETKAMSSDTPFHLPSPLPSWPPGGDFAKGTLDLGGLEITQISTFDKVWSAEEGGPNDAGATFYKPSPVPPGFSPLGFYAQSNSKPLFGWALAARDVSGTGILSGPLDYALVHSGDSPGSGRGYFWFPVAPAGYRPAGVVVTASPEKPSTDEVRCVRADFAGECENGTQIWQGGGEVDVHELRPKERGIRATGVHVGSFGIGTPPATAPPMACLNNRNLGSSAMPNLEQIKALSRVYSPVFCFHPDEAYLTSSVNWYFAKGALLYRRGDSTPSSVEPEGANLPQGGSNDGAFWLDLPADDSARNTLTRGDLETATVYVHAKPMLGSTFTDLAVWLFYPFNGGGRAKLGWIRSISLGRIGEHVGDWEHVTLRVSNLTGELWRVYLSQHSAGTWLDASEVEFEPGTNQPLAYSSLRGHANYAHPGLVLQGSEKLGVGIRNDTAKGGAKLDTAQRFEVVAADHLDGEVASPPWLDYHREWGPKITYDIAKELKKALKWIPKRIRQQIEKIVNALPSEVLGQGGPTGPKEKSNWAGDEK